MSNLVDISDDSQELFFKKLTSVACCEKGLKHAFCFDVQLFMSIFDSVEIKRLGSNYDVIGVLDVSLIQVFKAYFLVYF